LSTTVKKVLTFSEPPTFKYKDKKQLPTAHTKFFVSKNWQETVQLHLLDLVLYIHGCEQS